MASPMAGIVVIALGGNGVFVPHDQPWRPVRATISKASAALMAGISVPPVVYMPFPDMGGVPPTVVQVTLMESGHLIMLNTRAVEPTAITWVKT